MRTDAELGCLHTADQVRLVRALDGILYGTAATVFIIAGFILRYILDLRVSQVISLTVAFAAVATLLIPGRMRVFPEAVVRQVGRLKLAAICTAGLVPFISWWLRLLDSSYFLVLSGLAFAAVIWYCLELMTFAASLLDWLGEERLHREVRLARTCLIYLLLVPVASIYVTFSLSWLSVHGVNPSDILTVWFRFPPQFKLLILLPLLVVVSVLWRLREPVLRATPSPVRADARA